MSSLSNLNVGESGIVHNVIGEGPLRRKIIDMGITPGVNVEVIRSAPFGDPIEIKVRGYSLSIRKSEADIIILKSLSYKQINRSRIIYGSDTKQ